MTQELTEEIMEIDSVATQLEEIQSDIDSSVVKVDELINDL